MWTCVFTADVRVSGCISFITMNSLIWRLAHGLNRRITAALICILLAGKLMLAVIADTVDNLIIIINCLLMYGSARAGLRD